MNEQIEIWKRVESKQIADCRVFKVREDVCERRTDAARSTFYVTENPDWVNVVALNPEKEIVLIEQFRHGTEEIILEIPGGMVDENEEPEAAARRELLEETGYSSAEFIFLGKSRPNPAIQDNWIYHYLALDCEKSEEASFDEHESVRTKVVSFGAMDNLIESGKITHSLVVAAFYYLNLYKLNQPENL